MAHTFNCGSFICAFALGVQTVAFGQGVSYFNTVKRTAVSSKPVKISDMSSEKPVSDSDAAILPSANDSVDMEKEANRVLTDFLQENKNKISMGTSDKDIDKWLKEYFALRDAVNGYSGPNRKARSWRLYPGNGSMEFNVANLLKVMDEVGISNKIYVLAQACLETGYFTSRVYRTYNNLFGLYDSSTKDYYHFQRWEDSVAGYMKFIQYRYKGGDYLSWLKKIGYAEDPAYINKVRALVNKLTKS